MSNEPNLIPTANNFGWTSDVPNQITCKWLDFIAGRPEARVIDIGAGLGVASLPALATGAFVIVNDIDQSHLDHIKKRAHEGGYADKMQLLQAALPDLPDISPVDAIHASNVLHFLRGKELVKAAAWMFRSLKPEGQAFIQVGSVYAGHYRDFLPVYLERKRAGIEWPGEIDNPKQYAPLSLRKMLPDFSHVLDKETLGPIFCRAGFTIEYCEYYTRPGLPEECKNDGRENLGLIVSRK
jgi:SAM-dependent methyltransferase